MKNQKLVTHLSLIFLVLFSLIYLSQILGAPLLTDSYKLLSANQGPFAYDFKYWLHILTNPIHGEVQYRPLSYFFYLFSLRHILGTDPLSYHFIALGMFVISLSFLWKIIIKSNLSAILAVLFFISYPGHYFLLENISSNFKYYIPLIILVAGIWRVTSKAKLSIYDLIYLCIGTMISIMAHEGSFIFPFVFLLIRLNYYRVSLLQIIITSAPSLLYVICRVFIFKVPSNDFMTVDLSIIPSSLITYIKYVFGNNVISLPLVIITTIFSIYLAWKKKQFICITYWLSIILLLLPFAALQHHIFPNRSLFAIIPATLLIAEAIDYLLSLKIRYWILPLIISFVAYTLVINKVGQNRSLAYKNYRSEESRFYTKLAKQIEQIPKEETIRLALINRLDRQETIDISVFPGMLALNIPDRTFLLKGFFYNKRLFVLIKNGFIYYSKDNIRWSDIFNYKYNLDVDREIHTLDIDMTQIYKLNAGLYSFSSD